MKPIRPWPIERYILVHYCISYLQKYVKPTSHRPCHRVSHVHRHRQGQILATNTQSHIHLAQREVWLPGKTVNRCGAVRKGAEDWNNMVITPITSRDVNLWEDSGLTLVLHHSNCAGVRESSIPHFQQDCGICLWFSHDVSAMYSHVLFSLSKYCRLWFLFPLTQKSPSPSRKTGREIFYYNSTWNSFLPSTAIQTGWFIVCISSNIFWML